MDISASFKPSVLNFSVSVNVLGNLALAVAQLLLVVRLGSVRDGVLVCWHRHSDLSLINQRTTHCLFGLLSGGWRVDHLLRFKQELVDPLRRVNWNTTRYSVHVVGSDGHFLRVNEFTHDLFAGDALAAAAVAVAYGQHLRVGILRSLRIVTHLGVLSTLDDAAFCVVGVLSASRFALGATK